MSAASAGPGSPFDLPLEQLRQHRSAKWSRVAGDVLPAWTAEMDVRTAPAIAEALRTAVDRSDFGYAGDPAPVVEAFAGFARDTWGWDPVADGGSVRVMADVGVGVQEVLRAVTSPGDRVMLNPPVYLSFYPWLANLGLVPDDVPMLDQDRGGRLDLEGIERSLAGGTAVVLLCSPHNPLGMVAPREDLAAVAEMARAHAALVISDEIHAPLVHPGSERQFVPFLTVSEAAREVGVALHSPSKAWNLAGLKLAVGVVADPARWPTRMPGALEWGSGILGQYAAVAAYTDGRAWLEVVRREIEERSGQLEPLLAEHLPPVRYHRPSASYLAWLDCRELGLGDDPSAAFLDRGRVLLSPGPSFGPGGRGFARLNVGTSRALMAEAVRRMALAV